MGWPASRLLPEDPLMNTIKHKMFISYVALLIIPLATVATVNYLISAATIEHKSVLQQETIAALASQQIDIYFKDIENVSFNLINNSIIQERLRQPFVPYAQWTTRDIRSEQQVKELLKGFFHLKTGISSIILYGYNGINDYYHPTNVWNSSYDSASDAWYTQAAASDGRWALSGTREERQLATRITGEHEQVITFARLIRSLETFEPLGVLAINVHLHTLHNLSSLHMSSGSLSILDQHGEPVIGGGEWNAADRRDELRVTAQSPYTGWSSTYVTSRSELFKETKAIRNFIIVISVVLLFAAIVLAHFISQGIVRPLQQLRRKMKRVESGQLSSYTDTGADARGEIGELTRGFDRMLARIRALIDEIKSGQKRQLEVELRALQSQINPHFMYNTLNGMRWIAMMEGNSRLAKLISSFVNLLKFSARHTGNLIALGDELRHLEHYVDIMKMRNDQFTFHLDADENVRQLACVPFLLQPAVENAIFHGVVPAAKQCRIDVQVRRNGAMVDAVVADDGVGMDAQTLELLLRDADGSSSNHFNKIGLKNVYDRLKLQFGEQANIRVVSKPGAGTTVIIRWPAASIEQEGAL